MNDVDRALCRANELFLSDGSGELDRELAELLPRLVAAGYVRESAHSQTGPFWAFTDAGNELGCD